MVDRCRWWKGYYYLKYFTVHIQDYNRARNIPGRRVNHVNEGKAAILIATRSIIEGGMQLIDHFPPASQAKMRAIFKIHRKVYLILWDLKLHFPSAKEGYDA